MNSKLKIDYHFHPNLYILNFLAFRKCQNFWEKFREKGINCIVVTEHSYRNPKRAYEFMLKTKPDGFFCFPGLEYITKEGIDIVIFAENANIYDIKELRPYKLSFDQVTKLIISNNELFAFPAHPYTIGHTSVIENLDYEQYNKFVNTFGSIEIANATLDDIEPFMNKFPKLFQRQLLKIKKTQNIPKQDYPQNIKFVAVGSDAHYPKDIGYCYELEYESNLQLNEKNVFEQITSNQGLGKVILETRKNSIFHNFRALVNSLNESIIKIFYKI